MNKIIQNIKKFLNRYNPKAFTSMLLYLSNDLIDFKVDVIEKFNQLKEMYKKDNNYLDDLKNQEYFLRPQNSNNNKYLKMD